MDPHDDMRTAKDMKHLDKTLKAAAARAGVPTEEIEDGMLDEASMLSMTRSWLS